MRIYLSDIETSNGFYPITTLRKLEEVRTGIFSIREKWLRISNKQSYPLEIVDHKEESDIAIPAHLIPQASINLDRFFAEAKRTTDECIALNHWWDIVLHNETFIKDDIGLLQHFPAIQIPEYVFQKGPHPLLIHEDAEIEQCSINTQDGPVVIDKGAKIMMGAMLRGPIYLGEYSTVKMGAQLYAGTNIGKYCIVGGEVKNTVFQGYSNKSHHGYVGDSFIGEWCNLGAGTSNSNLKNTAGSIRVWNQSTQVFQKGPSKLGMAMGDHVKTAINTSITSGTVISSFSTIFSENGSALPKFLPLFSWGIDKGAHYKLDNLLVEISRWMKLKNQPLDDETREKIINLYKQHIS